MKVVYVVTGIDMGGAETQVIRMAKYMKSFNNDVWYISLREPVCCEMVDDLVKNGINFYSLYMSKGKASFKAYINFIKLINKIKPDVVHAHMIHANLLVRFSSPFLKCKNTINTVHGEEEFLGKRALVYRYTNFLVKNIVCCSKALQTIGLENKIFKANKCEVVYNGLNTKEYMFSEECRLYYRNKLNISSEYFVWITVGRLSKVKNQLYLLKEVNNLLKEDIKFKLVIVGDGEEKEELVDYVKMQNISNHVLFTGKINDVNKVLSSADAFVLSSIYEGLPLCLQEAGSVGLPLVSSNVGGCNEIVINNFTGILYEVGEGVLAESMKKIMRLSIDERNQLSNNVQKYVSDNFDIDKVMKEWMSVYQM